MARLTPLRLALLQNERTQKSLADEVGLDAPRMSLIVNGLVPDETVRAAIAAALGRTVQELFPGHDGDAPAPADAPTNTVGEQAA